MGIEGLTRMYTRAAGQTEELNCLFEDWPSKCEVELEKSRVR